MLFRSLARWSPAQRSTLDAYRVAIRAELLIGMELQIGADLQLVTSDALFSTLSYAAMQTLDWEVRACLRESTFSFSRCRASNC